MTSHFIIANMIVHFPLKCHLSPNLHNYELLMTECSTSITCNRLSFFAGSHAWLLKNNMDPLPGPTRITAEIICFFAWVTAYNKQNVQCNAIVSSITPYWLEITRIEPWWRDESNKLISFRMYLAPLEVHFAELNEWHSIRITWRRFAARHNNILRSIPRRDWPLGFFASSDPRK